MASAPNSLGNLPVIFTGDASQAKFYNSLYLSLASKNHNNGTFFNNTATNNDTVLLSSIGRDYTDVQAQKFLPILPSLTQSQTGNGNPDLYSNLAQSAEVQMAIQQWLDARYLSPDNSEVYGAQLNWQDGGQIWLTNDSSFSFDAGADTKQLANPRFNYGFIEDFIGNNPKVPNNNIDLTGINFIDLGIEVIPWYIQYKGSDTSPSDVSITAGAGPTAPLALVNPGSKSGFKKGLGTWSDALTWLQNDSNIMPFKKDTGSANIQADNGIRLVSPQNLSGPIQTVWDTTVQIDGKYYHHNFGKYLQYLAKNFIDEMYGANVPAAPWNMLPSNVAEQYAIYDVQFNGWEGLTANNYADIDSSIYIDIYYYNGGSSLPSDFSRDKYEKQLSKARLYWNSGISDFSDLSSLAGIYGANPSFDWYQTLDQATPTPIYSLGTVSPATEAVGDFLSAITYGMPLGKLEGSYIKPDEWIRQPGGGAEGVLSKNGVAFGLVQDNPNYYNQHAYGAWLINQNLYGFAFSDRLQPGVSTYPEPFQGAGNLTATTTRESVYLPVTAIQGLTANSKKAFEATGTSTLADMRSLIQDGEQVYLYNNSGLENSLVDSITGGRHLFKGGIVDVYLNGGFPVAIGNQQQFTPYSSDRRYELNNRLWVNDEIVKMVKKGAIIELDGYFPGGTNTGKVIDVYDGGSEDYLILDVPYNTSVPAGTQFSINNTPDEGWITSLAFVELNLGGLATEIA